MPAVRVKVGVSVDSSVARMFEPFAKAVQRANEVLSQQGKEAKKAAAEVAKAERQKTADAKAEAKKREAAAVAAGLHTREVEKTAALAHIAEAKKVTEALKNEDRKRVADEADAERKMADLRKWAAGQEIAQEKRVAAVRKQVAKEAAAAEKAANGGGFGSGFMRFAARRMLWGAGAYAVSMPGRLAAGMGVDPQDIGGLMAKNVERRDLATDISNVSYIPGEAGPNGTRQSPTAIYADAMKVAMETGSDPMKLLEGLQKFVGVTGDLKTGRDVMRDMARLALATGANMDTMVEAAGNMSARLGDIPNKAEVIEATMRHLAGMGLKGAMLPEDVAREMPKLAALAPRFAGSVADNIGTVFALAQEARQMGGAGSADQAATMVRGYVNAASTASHIKKAAVLTRAGGGGEHGFLDDRGMLRDPVTVISEMIKGATSKQTGAIDVAALSGAMGGMRGMGAIMGLVNRDIVASAEAYAAGKLPVEQLTEGIKAVGKESDRLKDATMSRVQVEESVQAKLKETKQQAQLFNNKLQDIVDKSMPDLTKALEELGPAVLKAFPAFIKLTKVFVEGAAMIAKVLGIKETSDTEGAETSTIAADKARRHLLRSPNKETLDAAKAELLKDEALAAKNASLLTRPNLGDEATDAVFGTGSVLSQRADIKGQDILVAAIADLKATIARGIPTVVQNPKDMHPPAPITRSGGPGRMPASREEGI